MRTRRQTGFTLMEVLLAVAIVSVIGTLIYGSFARTFAARDLANSVQERYHSVRAALDRMSREISMAFIYECRERPSLTSEPRQRSVFKVGREGKVDRMVFQSFAHLRLHRDAHESDQNVLTYYGESDPDDPNKTNLIRKEKPRIDTEPEEGGEALVMCPDIESFHIDLWDEAKLEWAEDWDCRQMERQNVLPRLVRLTLTVKNEVGEEAPFTTITHIFAQKPLANWIKPSQ